MAEFGRSSRQTEIWHRLDAIRAIVDKGLLSPTQAEYEGVDAVALKAEWEALVLEYATIHESNGTFG